MVNSQPNEYMDTTYAEQARQKADAYRTYAKEELAHDIDQHMKEFKDYFPKSLKCWPGDPDTKVYSLIITIAGERGRKLATALPIKIQALLGNEFRVNVVPTGESGCCHDIQIHYVGSYGDHL